MGTYYEGYLQRQKKKKEQTAQTGGTGSYYEGYLQRQVQNGNLDLDAITKQVAGRVNTWMENHGNFLSNYNTRFGGRKGDYSDGFVADSRDYLDTVSQQARNFAIEGNAIKGVLNQYGRLLNPEWVSGITKLLDDATAQQAQVRQAAAQDASYWNQFQNVDAYKKAQTYDAQSKADLDVLFQELADLEKQLMPARQIQAQIGGFNPYAYATAEEAMAAEKALKDRLSQATASWGGMDGMEKAYEDKQAYYDSAKRIQTEQAQRNADLPKLYKELEDIQKQAEAARKIQMQIGAFNPYAYATAEEAMAAEKDLKDQLAKATEKWGGMKQLEAALSEKESYYNTAKRYQDWEKLGSVKNNADFEKMSKPQSVEMLADLEAFSGYENMKPEEIATYNYHYNTGGKEKAEEYLKSITEGLNYREAEKRFETMENKPLAEILYGVAAGGDQFLSGMKGLWNTVTGNETYIPASTTQILGGMAREDLKDLGGRAFGSSLGQMAYDMLSTTTNMVPSLVVSGGVGMINPTAGAVVGAGLMGAGAAGNAYTEMINQGHSKEQARAYSTLVGSSEAGLSYLLGGIGKLGGKVSGNVIGKIVDKVDDIFTKVSIKLGGKMLSEGVEEGLQEVLTPWFKEIATNIEQDVNWEEAAYSGLLGALTALVTEGKSTVRSARAKDGKAGTAAPKTEKLAQLTQNEQTVVDKIVKDRVAAAEKSGQKVTAGLKKEIYNQVVEEMDRGYLSTEEIEAALGGETYQKYRESKSRQEALQKEYDTLGDLVESQMTAKQKQRFQELDGLLKAEKKNASSTALQSQLSREVSELVKNDRLAVSYQEQGRRGQKFQADVNQYSEKQRATVQAAIDSGILNNTNRAHEFVDLIAKISEQTEIQFHFADNAKLKESGFALEGVTVNGYVNQDGVTVNVNAAKALNSVVGHEITHVLEGEPELYSALAETITKFAKDKGEYDSRMKQLTKLYEGKEGYTGEDAGEKIQKELVADLVGDYLFTDKAFVEKLSTENRNVFQKIFDEIKYLCKLATAGSKEARQLEKAKKLFQEVYREGAKNPTEEGGVRYSLGYVDQSSRGKYDFTKSFAEQIDDYKNGTFPEKDTFLLGKTPDVLTKIGLAELPLTMNQQHVDYAVNGSYNGEQERINDHIMTEKELAQIPKLIADPVAIIQDRQLWEKKAKEYSVDVLVDMEINGKKTLVPVNVNSRGYINGVEIDANRIQSVHGNTDTVQRLVNALNEDSQENIAVYYINKEKAAEFLRPAGNPISRAAQELDGFIHSVTDNGSHVKMRIASVTESQQFKRWFGDWQNHPENASKVVNADGTPKVVYHGTGSDFSIFDKRKAKEGAFGRGFYFAATKGRAQAYSSGKIMETYLSIKTPYIVRDSMGFTGEDYQNMQEEFGLQDRITDKNVGKILQKQGYDGIMVYDGNGNVKEIIAFEPTQIKSATDNIGTFDRRSSDIRYSLSEQAAMDDDGVLPMPWQVRGQDVALEGPELPMPAWYREGRRAETAGRMESSRVADTARDVPGEVGLPMPEDTARTDPQRELDEAYRQRIGEDPILYDPEEDEGVETTRDRLEAKLMNREWELQDNRRQREQLIEDFDQKIADAQAKYDAKKHKETKNSQALLRRIAKLKRQKADRLAEADKRIADIQSRIEKLNEKLATGAPEKTDRLEEAYNRIDAQRDYDERVLAEKFYKKKEAIQKELGGRDQEAWIRDQARDLTWEMASWVKGQDASPLLHSLFKYRYEWQDLRNALEDIKDGVTIQRSPAQDTVREALAMAYEDRVQELDGLDAQYQKDLEKLQAKAQEQKEKAKIAETRKGKQQVYMKEVADMVGDTSTWKDKKIGLFYQINTLRRNLMHVVRDAVGREDHQKAAAIDDYLQGSYNRHEAMLNREATRIKDPYKKLKITKEEDAYIQMLGELRHNPDSKLLPDNVEEFYQANKDHIDKDKVERIIEMSRKTYDELLKRVNEVLRAQGMKEIPYRKGYFPHFTEDKQTWFAKFMNWKVNKNKIPTNIAGLTETYQPERSWQRFNKQRMSDTTDYSFTKGMDTYVQGALDWIYHIEDIQKRRAFENYLRYVHSDKGVQERINEIFASNEYDATEAQQQIDLILKEKENPLSNLVTDLRTGTNLLAGKKHSKDRNMEMDWNREVYSTMTNINSRISADMVAGSISAAMSNFIPITQSWSQVSPKSTLKAMGQAFSNILWDDGTVDKSAFLTNRLRKAENLNKGAWDKISDKVGMLMEAADWFTSQTVWRSKYMENRKAGMEEDAAIQNADQFCRDLMGDRSRGNMPTIFEAKNIKTRMLTAFQLEVANQYGYMFRDLPQAMQEKGKGELVKGYLTMFIGAYAYNALSSAITGRAQAFDPIRIIEELLADLGVQGTTQLLFGGEEEEEVEVDPWGAIKGLVENVIQEVPFVGGIMGGGRVPISSALPYDGNLMDIMSGIEKLSERDFSDITTEWMNPVYYLFLPMAGGQLRKIFQGLDMYGVFDGLTGQDHTVPGSYTGSGDLRFPVETGFLPVMQNVLFGQWSSENAQQYIDEGRSPLSEKQTQEFFDLGVSIQEYWDYLDGLKRLNKQSETGRASLNQQGDYIAGLDLTVEQKNLLINNLADRKEPIDMSTYDDYPNFEEFDYGTKNPDKYAVARAVGGYERYKEYREDLSDIREDETVEDKEQAVLRYINDLDAEYGEKIILYVSEYPNKENRDTYGYEIVDYLNSRGDISYSEMERILTKLGFDVDAEGRVNWD